MDTSIYTQAQICYYNNAFGPPPTTQCPASLPGAGSYSSNQHFAYANITWKPAKWTTAMIGYAGTFVGGSTTQINALQPAGTLAFNYQKPYATAIFDLHKGLSYRMTWNYYAYNGKGLPPSAIPGLAAIPSEDFNGSTAEFVLRYAF